MAGYKRGTRKSGQIGEDGWGNFSYIEMLGKNKAKSQVAYWNVREHYICRVSMKLSLIDTKI